MTGIVQCRPRQERATATVSRLLAAADGLLRTRSYSAITTADIARTAHVSIGTLYRYFPSKDAAYLRLYERTTSACATLMRDAMLKRLNAPTDRALREVIALMLDLYQKNQWVLIHLPKQAPTIFEPIGLLTVDKLVEQASRQFLEANGATQLARAGDGCVYFLIHNALVENIRRFVAEPHPGLSRKAFLDEAAELVRCYLQGRWRT